MDNNRDYENAKMTAVHHFLKDYLAYDNDELEQLKIKETTFTASKDKIMYVTFEELEDIREIYLRIAESQDTNIKTRDFIPPQNIMIGTLQSAKTVAQ